MPPGYPPVPPAYPPAPPSGYPPQYPGQLPPGYPPTGHPWPPQQLPPPPKRRRFLIAAVVAVVLLVVCAVPVGGIGAYLLARAGTADPGTSPQPSGEPQVTAAPRKSRSPAKRPVEGDSQAIFQAWMQERVEVALARQAQSLVAGDAAGYLKIVDPAKAALVAQFKRQFGSLRAMKVASWATEVYTITATDGKGFATRWRIRIGGHPCFAVTVCEQDDFSLTTTWKLTDPDTPVLLTQETEESANGPRPWQASELIARVGERTVVATTKAYASLLERVATQAEAAAKVADRFAYKGKPPTRYVVFYAGPTEWKSWYGWDPPEWSAGVSIEVGDVSNVVLNGKDLQGWFIDNLLRHELTHAATVPGGSSSRAWWLIEGIAEYAEMDGSSLSRYSALEQTGDFVKGPWNEHVAVSAPKGSDGDDTVAAAYGVAFLAVRHLAEKYGEQKMVDFFTAVVHEGETETSAALHVFGEPWSTVEKSCVEFIQSAV